MDISAIFGLLDSFFAVAENFGVPKEISQFIVFTILFLALAIYVVQKIYHWIPKRSSLEPPEQTPRPTENIDFSRLPRPSAELIGRSAELKTLTTVLQNKNKRLVHIQASGGIGKSALIFKWLQNMQPKYRGVSKVFAWSFYSQGSHETQNSSLPFFEHALPFFGYHGELPKDDTEKGRALAKCLRTQSFILILDGLEPLQHPAHILDGDLKDTALRALLDDIEYHGLNQSPSLIVVSSRQPLTELQTWDQKHYQVIDLQTLSDMNGAELLRKLGVIGTDKELGTATRELGGHALALVLLGKMLKTQFNGEVARRDQLPVINTAFEALNSQQALSEADEKLYRHVHRILTWYADFYSENNTPEAIFLDLLSLFDRPMGLAEKNILVKEAECAAPLRELSETDWQQMEKTLENASLLLPSEGMRTQWDCHPLIRNYFAQQFKATRPDQFRQAHLVLFEYYQQVPKKDQPDTLAELEPLYRAVVHGCLAGEYQKALVAVYQDRILRGNEYYSQNKLGVYSQNLTALAAFFPQSWSQPVQQVSEADQAWLLSEVSFCLMSLGRLTEAIEPRHADLAICVKTKDWNNAASTTQNLVDLLLPLGRLHEAADAATQAIDYAEKSEDLFEQRASHATRATVLHRQGQSAAEEFTRAEQLQQQSQPDYPQLYSIWGFQYCAWLLDQPHPDLSQVVARAEYSLNVFEEQANLLTKPLDHLTLARAYRQLRDKTQATDYFEKAITEVREARTSYWLPEFLIDRANFYLDQQQFAEARRDLVEAEQIIRRGDMKLYAVDYHLAMRRAEPNRAQFHENEAKKLIAATGYHLRKV